MNENASLKDDILDALEDSREKFLDAIEGLTDEELEIQGVVGEWSVKDIMSHLLAWETELVKLLWEVKQGEKPSTVHFGKKSLDELNQEWFTLTHDRPLERVMDDLEAVRRQTVRRVESFSGKDLSDPTRFPALEGKPLSEWIANDSYGHEAEHIEQMLAWRAQRK